MWDIFLACFAAENWTLSQTLLATPTSSSYVNWGLAGKTFQEACFEQERKSQPFEGVKIFTGNTLWNMLEDGSFLEEMQLSIMLSKHCQLSNGKWILLHKQRFIF